MIKSRISLSGVQENRIYQTVINRVYSFSYFKYGIYKPREVKKSDKETSAKHEFLYRIFFYLPRFINRYLK